MPLKYGTERFMLLLKSTTRHIHLYAAEVHGNELQPSDTVLTMDIDPDQEFNWSEEALQQVQQRFDALVESYNGQDLTEYNLRRIGSELEHFVRDLLGKGVISYNLQARVMNYSMGLPRVETEQGQGLFVK